MSQGVMLMWFILTGLSLAFVIFDIPGTPANPVIKWAFIILVAFTGPLGAFLYVLGCREPLKNTHEAYVAEPWRQVLGSTMHCAAGDGIGIIVGAAAASLLHLSGWADFTLEYALGFGFGWAFFQAFAMRDMAGGSYLRSLKLTFFPEFLSMNLLMAGMVATTSMFKLWIIGGMNPLQAGFWFVMSMALIVGFILAYPINWWLVGNGLKHGMLTVRKGRTLPQSDYEAERKNEIQNGSMVHEDAQKPSRAAIIGITVLSVLGLALGITISRIFKM